MEHTTSNDFDALHSNQLSSEHHELYATQPSYEQSEGTRDEQEPLPDVTSQGEPMQVEERYSQDSARGALPPEAQGDVNGGPLGCCLGVAVGLFLSVFVAIFSRLYTDPLVALFQHNYQLMGLLIRVVMGILAVVLAILCGYLGWKLGKRFYREYEAPPSRERKRKSKVQQQKI